MLLFEWTSSQNFMVLEKLWTSFLYATQLYDFAIIDLANSYRWNRLLPSVCYGKEHFGKHLAILYFTQSTDPDFSWLPTDLSESWGLVVLFTLERKKKVTYLITQVHVGISAEEQWHHVHMSFLSCKMDRSNSLPGNCVCISTIFQQSGRYVHLVLFGSDVQRCITILSTRITWSHAQAQGKNVCSAFLIVCLPISWFSFDGLKIHE